MKAVFLCHVFYLSDQVSLLYWLYITELLWALWWSHGPVCYVQQQQQPDERRRRCILPSRLSPLSHRRPRPPPRRGCCRRQQFQYIRSYPELWRSVSAPSLPLLRSQLQQCSWLPTLRAADVSCSFSSSSIW